MNDIYYSFARRNLVPSRPTTITTWSSEEDRAPETKPAKEEK